MSNEEEEFSLEALTGNAGACVKEEVLERFQFALHTFRTLKDRSIDARFKNGTWIKGNCTPIDPTSLEPGHVLVAFARSKEGLKTLEANNTGTLGSEATSSSFPSRPSPLRALCRGESPLLLRGGDGVCRRRGVSSCASHPHLSNPVRPTPRPKRQRREDGEGSRESPVDADGVPLVGVGKDWRTKLKRCRSPCASGLRKPSVHASPRWSGTCGDL